MKNLTINSVHCNHQIADPGDDDVIILVQTDAGPPSRYPIIGVNGMNHSDETDLTLNSTYGRNSFNFSETIMISLWDQDGPTDFIDAADMLGNFYILATDEDFTSKDFYIIGDDSASYSVNVTMTTITTTDDDTDFPDISSVLSDAATALSAWEDSKDYTKVEENTDDQSEMTDKLQDGMSGDTFSDVISVAKDILDLKAISLGLFGKAEVFVGIEGTFGVAADLADLEPSNFTDSSAIFAGVGIAEGVDGGIEGDLVLGFWKQSCEEIGGFYVGAEVDIEDIGGLSAVAYASADEDDFIQEDGKGDISLAKVVFVGVGVGLEDGVDSVESLFFAGTSSTNPVSQNGTFTNAVMVKMITCNKTMSDVGKDGVNLEFRADDDDTLYRSMIWNEFQIDTSQTTSNLPNDLFTSDNAKYQRTYRPVGSIIQFNDHFNLYLMVNNAIVMDDADDSSDFDLSYFPSNAPGSELVVNFKGSKGEDYDLTLSIIRS